MIQPIPQQNPAKSDEISQSLINHFLKTDFLYMPGAPRIISKKDLCRILGLWNHKRDKPYTTRLRQKYFTIDVLEQMNLTLEEYRKIQIFTYQQTQFIYRYLNITEDDFKTD